MCNKVLPYIKKMEIDASKKLARFTKTKTTESDHTPLEVIFDVNLPTLLGLVVYIHVS